MNRRQTPKGTELQETASGFNSRIDNFYARTTLITQRALQHNPYGIYFIL
jgi:hypothetical protein